MFFLFNFIRLYLGKWSKLTFLFLANMGLKQNNEIVYWTSWIDEKKMCETWLAMKILSLEMFFVVPLTLVWPLFGLNLACCCLWSKKYANPLSIWCWQWIFHYTMLFVFTVSEKKKCFNTKLPKHQQSTRWWFQIVFIFTPTRGNDPIWRSCFQTSWNHQLDQNGSHRIHVWYTSLHLLIWLSRGIPGKFRFRNYPPWNNP